MPTWLHSEQGTSWEEHLEPLVRGTRLNPSWELGAHEPYRVAALKSLSEDGVDLKGWTVIDDRTWLSIHIAIGLFHIPAASHPDLLYHT